MNLSSDIPFPFQYYSDVRVLGIEVYLAGARFNGQKPAEGVIVNLIISTNGEYQDCACNSDVDKKVRIFNINSSNQVGGVTLKGPFSTSFSYIATRGCESKYPGSALQAPRSDKDQTYSFCPTPFTTWTVEVPPCGPQISSNSKEITVKVKWRLAWSSASRCKKSITYKLN
jgi:hypothetical protein